MHFRVQLNQEGPVRNYSKWIFGSSILAKFHIFYFWDLFYTLYGFFSEILFWLL